MDSKSPVPSESSKLSNPISTRTRIEGGGESIKRIFIRDLRERDLVRSTFLVKSKELNFSKNAKAYLALLLADRTGEVDCRVWDGAESISEVFNEGDVIAVSGKATQFQNRLQLIVQHVAPVSANEIDLNDYLPAATADRDEMYLKLISVFENVQNPWIRKLGLQLLNHPEIAPRYKKCPAAKTIHHAFIGGLLSHSLQLISLVDSILAHYPVLDRDLLVFGAAFHDFGKIFELSYDRNFGYTDEGKLVGHITIGATLIDREIEKLPGFPRELEFQLKHLVLSHHGKLEYGSPKRPATLEALMLHYLDDLDSKMNSIETLMKNENNSSRWTAYHRAYDQSYYKPDRYVVRSEEEID